LAYFSGDNLLFLSSALVVQW